MKRIKQNLLVLPAGRLYWRQLQLFPGSQGEAGSSADREDI